VWQGRFEAADQQADYADLHEGEVVRELLVTPGDPDLRLHGDVAVAATTVRGACNG
jgi:hypothetical protein